LKVTRIIGAIWAILGLSLILGSAIIRIIPHVFSAFDRGLSAVQWIILIIWCGFMLITEGYRGFQKLFSPRFAARTWYLTNHGKKIDLILAPFFCMAYFGTTRKRIITSWALTIGIVILIVVVHLVSQPWRGIIDSGVVLGLVYGLIWVYIFTLRSFVSHSYLVDPEVVPSNLKL
jgi:hypothetical protein